MQKRGMTRRALAVGLVFAIIALTARIYVTTQENQIQFSPDAVNQPPEFHEIAEEIFVCEGSQLSYTLHAQDPENDPLRFDIQPKNPFFLKTTELNQSIYTLEIYTPNITKLQAKKIFYDIELFTTDEQYVDTQTIEFTTIEINNPPTLEDIPTQTLRVGKTLELKTKARDKETDELKYNLNYLSGRPIFDIDQQGVINYTAKPEDVGTYDIRLCVTDTALKKPSPHIAICGQDGSAQTTCNNFQLAILTQNTQPTILSFYPEDQSIISRGDLENIFNISKFDPDRITPDTFWYVDDELIETHTSLANDEFSHVFGCNVSGEHLVQAIIDDGLAQDQINWSVSVNPTYCPQGIPHGTNLKTLCTENWGCKDWGLCQLALPSRDIGTLAYEDYDKIQQRCQQNGWDTESCGFQIRDCVDANSCGTMQDPFPNIQACRFTQEPSCFDKIRNCHDSFCELQADCGGPCQACATCSDGMQNQEEQGVDCGGACPNACATQEPLISDPTTQNILKIIFVIAAAMLIWQGYRIIKMKRQIEGPKKQPAEESQKTDEQQENKNQKTIEKTQTDKKEVEKEENEK